MSMKVCPLRDFISVKKVPEKSKVSCQSITEQYSLRFQLFSYIYYVTVPLSRYNSGHDNQKFQKVNGQRKRCPFAVNALAYD